MVGVQPLAHQHMHLFDGSADEDAVLQVPPVADKQPQLTEKVDIECYAMLKVHLLLPRHVLAMSCRCCMGK